MTKPLRGVFFEVVYSWGNPDLPMRLYYRWEPTKAQLRRMQKGTFPVGSKCRCVLDAKETLRHEPLISRKGAHMVAMWAAPSR
jgi:hypothetical protein